MRTNRFRGRRRKERRRNYVGVRVRHFAETTGQQRLLERIAEATGVRPIDILGPTRGEGDAAFARSVLMYLLNTGLGHSFDEVAAAVGRRRQTVSRACALVEDLRDEPEFDADLSALEQTLETQVQTEDRENA